MDELFLTLMWAEVARVNYNFPSLNVPVINQLAEALPCRNLHSGLGRKWFDATYTCMHTYRRMHVYAFWLNRR